MNIKRKLVLLGIVGMIALSAAGCGQKNKEDDRFIGEAEGVKGKIKVELIIEEGELAEIIVLSQKESDYAKPVFENIPKEIVEKKTVNVDDVTGATISCQALKKAVLEAAKKAELDLE